MSRHDELVALADRWLKQIGCGVTMTELVCVNATGEIPDAIGWRSGVSIVVEAKTSRSDFLADRRKFTRATPELGMGDWRFYLCDPGVIYPEDLPRGWGLLYVGTGVGEAKVRRVHGAPKGNASWSSPPNTGNKRAELAMTISALRRINLRGGLRVIYEPMPEPVKEAIRKDDGAKTQVALAIRRNWPDSHAAEPTQTRPRVHVGEQVL